MLIFFTPKVINLITFLICILIMIDFLIEFTKWCEMKRIVSQWEQTNF